MRCFWCDEADKEYVLYHDQEWAKPCKEDQKLFELLVLEMFQAGLSWKTILHKRKAFLLAFSNFDVNAVANFDESDISRLYEDASIVRNKRKILATIQNAKVFIRIQKEWTSFSEYIWHFTSGKTIYEYDKTSSPLSNLISKDLKQRGMSFVGPVIVYSYLQAIGIINSHEPNCFLYKKEEDRE